MATPLDRLPAWKPDSDLLNVVIDTPKGSRNKYKYDAEEGVWRLSKMLPLGAAFPFDFGFVPSTRGEDGDPIDVLVLTEETSFPGCVVPARLIGVLEAEQTESTGKTLRNDRLVAVLETIHNPPPFRSLEEVGRQRLEEIEHFFISYNEMEGRKFKTLGHHGPIKARRLVEEAMVTKSHGRRGKSSSNGRARRRSKTR